MVKLCFFCLCLSFFLLDSDVGGDHPSMALSLHSCRFRPSHPRTLRLFSAFSPAGPKGCSKDDERVLKGCLSLCHPSHNLFFRRKHLHGTILFPKFSAKIQQIFEIYKDFSNKMQFYLYFVLQSLVICTTVRLYLRRIPYLYDVTPKV